MGTHWLACFQTKLTPLLSLTNQTGGIPMLRTIRGLEVVVDHRLIKESSLADVCVFEHAGKV